MNYSLSKKITPIILMLLLQACGSQKSFQSFFNSHKREIGVTAFQVPNFMRILITNISPETTSFLKNTKDFKYIVFNNTNSFKKNTLIREIDLITSNNFVDILRSNTPQKTKIISVKEDGDIITQAIICNASSNKTTIFYLKGKFNPNNLKHLSKTNQFENLSNTLIKKHKATLTSPRFNPN